MIALFPVFKLKKLKSLGLVTAKPWENFSIFSIKKMHGFYNRCWSYGIDQLNVIHCRQSVRR